MQRMFRKKAMKESRKHERNPKRYAENVKIYLRKKKTIYWEATDT